MARAVASDMAINAADLAEAMRALGVRDVVVRGDRVATLRSALAAVQRRRLDAVHASVVLDEVAPRADASWRPVCCWCLDSLEVAAGSDVEHYRINTHTSHDTGCCAFCESSGPDTLVASIDRRTFAAPSRAFLDSRCAYADRGGRLATLTGR